MFTLSNAYTYIYMHDDILHSYITRVLQRFRSPIPAHKMTSEKGDFLRHARFFGISRESSYQFQNRPSKKFSPHFPFVSDSAADKRRRDNTQRVNVCQANEILVGVPKSGAGVEGAQNCLLYTSPSPRDRTRSRMPSSA